MTSPAVAAQYRDIKVTPRIRMAALMYASGAVKSKTAASRLAGVSKEYFVNMTNHNEELRRIVNDTTSMIEDESIATSVIIQKLSRKAVGRLAELMSSNNEAVAFRAAQDLADRGQETSKTQKFQVEALTITGEDARAMAAAMVESAAGHTQFGHVAKDGLVEIDTDQRTEHKMLTLIPGGLRGKTEASTKASNDPEASGS